MAGGFAVWSQAESDPVALDAQPVDLICSKCGHHATLAYEEFMRTSPAKVTEPAGPVAGSGRSLAAHARRADFACSSCGEKAAQQASKCPKHGTYYAKYTESGGNARCAECARGG